MTAEEPAPGITERSVRHLLGLLEVDPAVEPVGALAVRAAHRCDTAWSAAASQELRRVLADLDEHVARRRPAQPAGGEPAEGKGDGPVMSIVDRIKAARGGAGA